MKDIIMKMKSYNNRKTTKNKRIPKIQKRRLMNKVFYQNMLITEAAKDLGKRGRQNQEVEQGFVQGEQLSQRSLPIKKTQGGVDIELLKKLCISKEGDFKQAKSSQHKNEQEKANNCDGVSTNCRNWEQFNGGTITNPAKLYHFNTIILHKPQIPVIYNNVQLLQYSQANYYHQYLHMNRNYLSYQPNSISYQ